MIITGRLQRSVNVIGNGTVVINIGHKYLTLDRNLHSMEFDAFLLSNLKISTVIHAFIRFKIWNTLYKYTHTHTLLYNFKVYMYITRYYTPSTRYQELKQHSLVQFHYLQTIERILFSIKMNITRYNTSCKLRNIILKKREFCKHTYV